MAWSEKAREAARLARAKRNQTGAIGFDTMRSLVQAFKWRRNTAFRAAVLVGPKSEYWVSRYRSSGDVVGASGKTYTGTFKR